MLRALLEATLAAVLALAALLAYPSVFPTGVTRYDPARAYNCYVLFGATDGVRYVNPYFARSGIAGMRPTPDGPQEVMTNWVYRAQPVPYDWAPAGTPHSEIPVVPPDLSKFHIQPAINK